MSNTAQAEARKSDIRPARVWQPTDLLHPIAPEGGFLPNAWRPSGAAGFDPHGFTTPVLDLKALSAPVALESSSPQDEAPGADSPTSEPMASDATPAEAGSKAQAPAAPPAAAIDPQALEIARAEGHAQGMAQARAAMQADVQSETHKILSEDHALLDKLQTTLADLQQSPQAFFEPLKRLALHLAEQLVLAELQIDGSAIERLVQRCVDDLAQHDESMIVVQLHPSDVERLHNMRERTGLNEGSALRLQADTSLLPGSVRASANDALVEDLIADRLSTLARALQVNEPRWSAQSAFSAERIAAERLPSTGVEDARPRMANSASIVNPAPLRQAPEAEIVPSHEQAAHDTVAAIDEILNDEDHV
jgi:flagellar biosynthesis/type III secretory pathway protein FliH